MPILAAPLVRETSVKTGLPLGNEPPTETAVDVPLTEIVALFGFPGLRPGDRWCVCITRWKASLEAGVACPVILEATHIHALEFVDLEDLQRHAVALKPDA